MKRLLLTLCLLAGFTATQIVLAQAAKPIDDASLGLSKGSVFDVPTPQPFTADGKGASGAAKAAYGAPPLPSVDACCCWRSRSRSLPGDMRHASSA